MKKMRLLFFMIVAASVTACATNDNFAYLQGERWRKTELNTYDVAIISVDGTHYIERYRQPIRIDPGVRTIVVQAPPAHGFDYGEERSIKLDVKPCTRYWFEAKKSGPLAQDFVPRVNYSEPIAGCNSMPVSS